MIRNLIILVFSMASMGASAQQPLMVETEFIAVALDKAVKGLFYHDGNAPRPFNCDGTGTSAPQPYKGQQRLVLRERAEDFAARPAPPSAAASVLLPLNAKRVLLVCLKSDDQPLRILAYDISTDSQAGDYRFFNFSRQPVRLMFGQKQLSIDPGQDASISDPTWRTDVLDLPIQVATMQNNQFKVVYSSVWGHRPGRKNLIFTLDGIHPSKPIHFFRFFDIPGSQSASNTP